jgi:hypothetical protein
VDGFAELHDFFVASVGAAAALIGLLFVAISIAPERIFGEAAESARRANAERAFTALGNVFFVSLGALLPHIGPTVIIVFAVLAIGSIVRMAASILRSGGSWQHVGIISFGVYLLELSIALRVAAHAVLADKLTFVVLGLYVYALGIAWGLLGAKESTKAGASLK